MREITVAAVQMKPVLGEIEDNLVKMSDFVSKIASQQKVDLILFPELVTSGYEMGVKFTEVAQIVPGPSVNLMAQRAQEFGVHIGFGMVTKEKVESIIYNTAVLVGPDGELVGEYQKTHLKGEERMAFREGFKLPVFETEIGDIGFVLGWDIAFPEVARSLALEGAQLLCVLASWEKDEIDEWRTYIRARAFENACFVAATNRVGEDVTATFGGESMIIGPRGKIHASLTSGKKEDEGEKEKKGKDDDTPPEGYCVARIDLDEVRKFREQYQTLQARQPTVYRAVVRRY